MYTKKPDVPDMELYSRDEHFVVSLPFRRDHAEKDQITGTGVMDVLDGTGWDHNNLPKMNGRGFPIDLHAAGTFQDVIEFGAFLKPVREG